MVDFASLDLKIDSTEVDTGVARLDKLTAAGSKAERAVDELGRSMEQAGRSAKTASQAAADYAAKAQMTAAASMRGGEALGKTGGAARLATHHLQNLTFQLNDMFVGLASGQKPMTVFVQQGAQIGQIAQQAGLGIGGMAREFALLAARAAPAGLAIGAAAFMLDQYRDKIEEAANTDAFIRSLGLTADEMKKLEDTGVTLPWKKRPLRRSCSRMASKT